MILHRLCAIALLTAVSASTLPAQSGADTVVLRVTSPRGVDVAFGGIVTLADAKTERRLENLRTPFELRLPAQDIDARFTAADGASLSGEVVRYRNGAEHGKVWGTVLRGEMALHFKPTEGYGFGVARGGWLAAP